MPSGVYKLGPFEKNIKTFSAFASNDRKIGYEFWLFHGINYLSGNPIPFGGIYSGQDLYRSSIFSVIMERHINRSGDLDQSGRECLVWASSTPYEMHRAVMCIKAFARKYGRDPHHINDPYVEAPIRAAAGLMVGSVGGWGSKNPVSPSQYYKSQASYDRAMNRAGKLVLSYNLSTRKGWEFWAGVHREVIKKYGLPDGVKPFRLDYKERNNRGYLMYVGRLEDMDASGRKR